ncbi:MAG: hypothetical protein KDC85_02775 [Saprospiraceae bacterium]|nr:hypothetical protein [Saprospiraceae bacterium]MCB9324191.1 N(G),N(G)-dimethylarginine dimethylaminohydrolase [Lewinellaceae bacterium]
MFKRAIVRTPGKSLVNGLTEANLGIPDYQRALSQHAAYIKALEACGLEVSVLEADENFPDSTFVEDVALLTPHCAIITRPGAPSRRGETDGISKLLEHFYDNIEIIEAPGTVEAGDIMMVGSHFYIGLSGRTNEAGARQVISILEKYGMRESVVSLEEVLHLKTGVTYLENNNLLATGEFLAKAVFQPFHILEIEPDEAYAANAIWVNGTVIVPEGYPKARKMIEHAGYPVLALDMSEFQKLDGGLSCLSLRF